MNIVKLTQDDLIKYSFSHKNIDELPLLHTVTLYGNTVIEVICEEIEVQSYSPIREKECDLTVNSNNQNIRCTQGRCSS